MWSLIKAQPAGARGTDTLHPAGRTILLKRRENLRAGGGGTGPAPVDDPGIAAPAGDVYAVIAGCFRATDTDRRTGADGAERE